ncbi:hypothetical protein QBC35DRAFT_144011 [Podospora australis]|uniref:Uncharacterized protein n=1 Tax=Podospora australis TaxID=1536484 RepID=A0AAN7AE76_9PEZI|nr:hypothetical protein QBC35DRAFT_144011 [Podospora australis]
MSRPANAAVRERRRRSTPMDLEQLNVMKALTAAEHSRRQFVLNFAASKETNLLIPGQKAIAVKMAEESVASWLNHNGLNPVSSDFFKFSVDAQLWTKHVGTDVDFPFAFMRNTPEGMPSPGEISPGSPRRRTDIKRPTSDVYPVDEAIEVRSDDQSSLSTVPSHTKAELPEAQLPRKQMQQASVKPVPPPVPTLSPFSSLKRQSMIAETAKDKRRSLSLTSIDDIKMSSHKQDKVPFLSKLGRSWSRRMSAN